MCDVDHYYNNASNCMPCTACPPLSTILVPCGLYNDTICRRCLPGFVAGNESCVLHASITEVHAVMLFMIALFELLFCACWWRWWRLNHKYSLIPGTAI